MLSRLQSKKEQGFTIIEVLIVLAIAGLIMLIVFLAVPALQRNQRNNARNADASRVAASITECLANRNGVTGSCDSLDLTNGTDGIPAGTSELQPGNLSQLTNDGFGAASTTTMSLAFGLTNGGCNAAGTGTAAGQSTRSFSIVYMLEPSVTRCVAS
jgi:prepilin-type N-terminal cleavage/methylation domain-containing protein